MAAARDTILPPAAQPAGEVQTAPASAIPFALMALLPAALPAHLTVQPPSVSGAPLAVSEAVRRRTTRPTAGQHSNFHHLPRPANEVAQAGPLAVPPITGRARQSTLTSTVDPRGGNRTLLLGRTQQGSPRQTNTGGQGTNASWLSLQFLFHSLAGSQKPLPDAIELELVSSCLVGFLSSSNNQGSLEPAASELGPPPWVPASWLRG
ncbi:unnamed protein product [Boreogadus saida]